MSKIEKVQKKVSQSAPEEGRAQEKDVVQPPQEILKAVRSGDVKSLTELLAREHRKRMPDATASKISEENTARFLEQPGIEKELIEQMMKIAADNSLTPDWVLIRALKVYVREYQRTGQL
jgi:hypothetical protein